MSNILTDPPKASKIKIKKKSGRENQFRIVIKGENFEEGAEYMVKFQFPDCTTNEIPLHYASGEKLTTGTYITPNTDCIENAISKDVPPSLCNVIWVQPSSETDHDIAVEWIGVTSEQATETVSFFQRILNFLKRLFGGN